MSLLSPPIGVRPREEQFVGDLANLLRRHRVRTGSPEYLGLLASVLETNDALRGDLLMLCNAISRLAESDLEPEELLQLVAKAVVNRRSAEGEIAIPAELREIFIQRWQEWQARADSLSALYWGDVAPQVPAPEPRIGKFAAAASLRPERERAAPAAPEAAEITPETRIGELTLSQLRTYLEDIEQRVGRLQPYLASLQESLPEVPSQNDAARAEEQGLDRVEVMGGDAHAGTAATTDAEPTTALVAPIGPAPTADVDVNFDADADAQVDAQGDIDEPLTAASMDKAAVSPGSQKEEPAPRLVLRNGPALEEEEPEDLRQPALFRSVSEERDGRSRSVLWVAAALMLLVPAAYYGRPYVYPSVAPMPLSPPPAPAFVPSQASPSASADQATPAPAAPDTPNRPAGPAPHILPRAVRMEAQAARAEQHESSGAQK